MWILCLFFVTLHTVTNADDGLETVACSGSGQMVIGPSGTITTPGYKDSKPYPPRARCNWKFQLPPTKYISFEFEDIDIELAEDCKPDAIEFLSLNPPKVLRKFCGSVAPKRIILSTDNGIWMRFLSDDLYEGKGAKIKYQILNEHHCGEDSIRCKNGECIPKNKKCNKVDECGDGTDEEECSANVVAVPKTCGKPTHHPIIGNGDRIIGGQEAAPHSWPWQVSLQNTISFPSGHYCGGALINNLWVVTAGHCLYGRNLDSFKIHLGMHNRFAKDDGEVTRHPSRSCIHPDFVRQTLKDDIALIKLNAPVSYTDTIKPVCLPPVTENLEDGKYCHVTGWGSTYGTGSFHVLKQTMVPVIGYDKCRKMVKLLPLSPNAICSGYSNGQYSPCFGDSGGPFVCDYNGAWHLSGVVSWGPMICAYNQEPPVYTKIADYKPWVEKIIEHDEKGIPNNCM